MIFTEEPEALRIQDIFGNSEEVLLDLVVEVTRLARKQRARSVSMALLEQSRLIPLLERIGFRQRPDYSNMYCYAAGGQLQLLASAPNHWLIHVGDRDV